MNRKYWFSYLGCLLTIAMFPVAVFGQSSGPLNEFALGVQQRNAVVSYYRVLQNTRVNEIGESVFRGLLATSVVKAYGRDLPWELTLIVSDEINAFTTAGGKVYVTTAMIEKVLRTDYGLWAAVLGHEIGHGLGNHIHKAYVRHHEHELQRLNLLNLSNQGQTWASWALVAHMTVGSLAKLKVSRDEESEADYLGLMMMAESGVHPDHSIAMSRRMAATTGDLSKVWAFLSSDHPRWVTREENAWRNWNRAISRFRNRWNDPAGSPGGMPPPIVGFGKAQIVKDGKTKSVSIVAPYIVRNVNEAFIGVVFEHKGKVVQGALPEYRFDNGALGTMRPARISSGIEDSQFSISIPALALDGKERTLDAFLVVWANGKVIGYSEKLRVSFPKP